MSPASGQNPTTSAARDTLPWLRALVREVLRLPESEDVDARTLRELNARSVQVVALQFRIVQDTSVTVEMAELVGGTSIADIAALIDVRRSTADG
jgi:hypothetical protein